MNNENFKCIYCEKIFSGNKSLGVHLNRSHPGKTTEDYILDTKYNGIKPVCKCGRCNQNTLFSFEKRDFRKYITGHNSYEQGFSSTNQPIKTEEHQRKNNESVRKAYSGENGEILKDRISNSLKEKYKDPSYRERVIAGQLKSWQNEERKEQRSKYNRIMWESEDHYDKVFTPEMRKKISLANMGRKLSNKSAEETAFVNHLKRVLGEDDVLDEAWINTDTRAASYDAYIRSERCYVEFDGVYYHGLDQPADKPLNEMQLHNQRNDLEKNQIIIERNKRLIRIKSTADYSLVRSFKDLEKLSYLRIDPVSSKTS